MIRISKIVACLYASVFIAGATVVTFDGNQKAQGCDYINFKVRPSLYGCMIEKVSINENRLIGIVNKYNKSFCEITLIIPGYVKPWYNDTKTPIADKEVFGMQT